MNSSKLINVMLVDDSFTVRGFIRRILEKEPDMNVVGSVSDGEKALKLYDIEKPDIVIMDIEMPNMDGLHALKEIIKRDPNAKVIMCSSLTTKGGEATFKALEIGASDYVSKPSSKTIDSGIGFEQEILAKIRALVPKEHAQNNNRPTLEGSVTLKPKPEKFLAKALIIGASTGGPAALMEIFSKLNDQVNVPVFITQHIPADFSEYLAQTIQKNTSMRVIQAENHMPIEKRNVYIAPGGLHMGIANDGTNTIQLIDSPPVNFSKPSVNVMIDNISKVYDSGLLVLILTGMGEDGLDACIKISANSNNIIIAQDYNSSVVWGMPGAVAKAGLCSAVLALDQIADQINTYF